MKKRWSLLLILLLVLSACAAGKKGDASGAELYYRAAPALQRSGGVLTSRPWQPAGEMPTYSEFLNDYFSQRPDADLAETFPSGLRCLGTSLDDGVLTVILSPEYDELSGIDRTIAAACMVRTLTQFESITGVCLETEKSAAAGQESVVLQEKDFVLEDLGATNVETPVRLYFSDSNGRYLISTERASYFSDAGQIPAYIVQQLIDGPKEPGQLAVMPEGTALRSAAVADGVCTVDLSSEFLLNKPDTALMERLTILSIVNSLTELEPIQSVAFLVEGEPVERYLHQDLSQPFTRDETAIDLVRTGLNEADATLYVAREGSELLSPVPVSIRRTTRTTLPEALLDRLLEFEDVNGLHSALPQGTTVQSVTVNDGTCHVVLSRELLACADDQEAERLAIYSVTATLASLDEIRSVQISIQGQNDGFQYYTLRRAYAPQPSWYE